MLPELRGLSYPERLKALGITALETRRLGGDLIEVFKIVKGFLNIDRKIFSRRHSVFVEGIVRNCDKYHVRRPFRSEDMTHFRSQH